MMNWLHFLSCRHSLARWQQAEDESSTGRTPLACRVHFGICRHCRRYRKQLKLIRRALRQLEVTADENADARLSVCFKSELEQRLQNELLSGG